MGESKRKAFNFFHSYYDVGKELNDKDRLQFYDALLKKQFENIDSELSGMAKFAYISQSHSIEAQIKGYFDKIYFSCNIKSISYSSCSLLIEYESS